MFLSYCCLCGIINDDDDDDDGDDNPHVDIVEWQNMFAKTPNERIIALQLLAVQKNK